jgi:hypothetical protein
MNRYQSPTTESDNDTRKTLVIAGLIIGGVVGALVMPLWIAAMAMFFALIALRKLTTTEPIPVPVVIRRDSRR